MKPLTFTLLAAISVPGLASPISGTAAGEIIGLSTILMVGAVSLIMARRRLAS